MTTTTPSSATECAAARYLSAAGRCIDAVRRDLPQLSRLGQRMAEPLLAGGNLFTPPVAKFWPSEFGHRAGGLMGLRLPDYVPSSERDVAYFVAGAASRQDEATRRTLQRLVEGPARLFVIGREDELPEGVAADRFEGFTGGTGSDEGLFARGAWRPLCPLWPLDRIVRGWVTAGEMIAAGIRAGRMPIIWMSVWLEGAWVRNAHFVAANNLREPWSTPLFHEDHYIPPLAAGHVGGEFLDALSSIHATLMGQLPRLTTAGRWMSQAHREGKRVHVVAVGHSYPKILALGDGAAEGYPVEWGWSASDLRRAHPADLGEGDVAVHLGYSPVDVGDVQALLGRGVRFIYSSPYGRPAALADHPDLLWLDLPWRPGDATVDVPGYSVRILPMSSSAQTLAYFALLAEMADASGWG